MNLVICLCNERTFASEVAISVDGWCRTADGFDFVSIDLKGDRPLNKLYRDNQTLVAIDCCQNSFDPIQTAATDSNTMTDIQKG